MIRKKTIISFIMAFAFIQVAQLFSAFEWNGAVEQILTACGAIILIPALVFIVIDIKQIIIERRKQQPLNKDKQSKEIKNLKKWMIGLLAFSLFLLPNLSFLNWRFSWSVYLTIILPLLSTTSIIICFLIHNKICRIENMGTQPKETE